MQWLIISIMASLFHTSKAFTKDTENESNLNVAVGKAIADNFDDNIELDF